MEGSGQLDACVALPSLPGAHWLEGWVESQSRSGRCGEQNKLALLEVEKKKNRQIP
jgi:hypothetical protein